MTNLSLNMMVEVIDIENRKHGPAIIILKHSYLSYSCFSQFWNIIIANVERITFVCVYFERQTFEVCSLMISEVFFVF